VKKAKGKNGGARPGAGRPKKPPVTIAPPSEEINWAEVQRFADVGGLEEEILTAGLVSEEQAKNPAVAERLRQLVERGSARKNLLLRERIHKVGIGEANGGGNTLALEARNRLGWDKQTETAEAPPDVSSAHARLRLTLERLAKVASEEHGREITPAELLITEAFKNTGEKVH
jgi:hypothetical protein